MESIDFDHHSEEPKGAKRARGPEDRLKDPKRVKKAKVTNKKKNFKTEKQRSVRSNRVAKHPTSPSEEGEDTPENLDDWLRDPKPPNRRRNLLEVSPKEEEQLNTDSDSSGAFPSQESGDESGHIPETLPGENEGNHQTTVQNILKFSDLP